MTRALRKCRILAQSPQDVLDINDGVVDEFTNRDGKSTERHHVHRESPRPKDERRNCERKRQRGQCDDRRTDVEEEQDEDDRDDDARFDEDAHDVVDRALDKARGAEGIAIQRDSRGHRLLGAIEDAINLPRQLKRVGTRRFLHADNNRRNRAIRSSAALSCRGESHIRHITNRDRHAVAGRDKRATNVIDTCHARDLTDRKLLLTNILHVARGCRAVRCARGLGDFGNRNTEQREPILLHVDAVLGKFATDRNHLCDTRDRKNLAPELKLRVRAQIHRRRFAARRREREEHDLAGEARHRRDFRVCILG